MKIFFLSHGEKNQDHHAARFFFFDLLVGIKMDIWHVEVGISRGI